MIQLYARISDLIPTEPPQLTTPDKFFDPDEEIMAKMNMDCYESFLNNIAKNGIKYCLAVDPDGTIKDGNCRYWCTKRLNLKFVPINLAFFTGQDKTFYPKKLVKKSYGKKSKNNMK